MKNKKDKRKPEGVDDFTDSGTKHATLEDAKIHEKYVNNSENEMKETFKSPESQKEEFWPVESMYETVNLRDVKATTDPVEFGNGWTSPKDIERPHSPYFSAPKFGSLSKGLAELGSQDFSAKNNNNIFPARFMKSPGIQPKQTEFEVVNNLEGADRNEDNMIEQSILEDLLPTKVKMNGREGPSLGQRKGSSSADLFFRKAFLWLFALMNFIGLFVMTVYPKELRDEIFRSGTAYRAVVDSSSIFAMIMAVGIGLSLVWSWVLATYTEVIVYGMIAFIPGSLAVAALYAFVASFTGPWNGVTDSQDSMLLLLSLILLTMAAIIGYFLFLHQDSIKTTVAITRTASEILQENKSIFTYSILLVLGYLIYIALWLTFYCHLLLLGHAEKMPGDNLIKTWKLSSASLWLQGFFIVMLAWSTSVLSSVQKYMIGGVVSTWYFNKKAAASNEDGKITRDQLIKAFDESFGQICFASLILTATRLIRYTIRFIHQLTKKIMKKSSILTSITGVVNVIAEFVERIIGHFTDFSIYWVAYSGDSFWNSSQAIYKIFRRNLLLSITTDLTAQVLLMSSCFMIAILSGLTVFIFASHHLRSHYGWLAGLIFTLLATYILQFFATIFVAAIDATFMCYAVDVDTERVSKPKAHQVFAAKVATMRNIS